MDKAPLSYEELKERLDFETDESNLELEIRAGAPLLQMICEHGIAVQKEIDLYILKKNNLNWR